MSDWRRKVIEYVEQTCLPVWKFGHQPRLYELTLLIGQGLDYDDDVVFASAWLHDLGVFIGHRPEDPALLATWDHVAYACRLIPEVLAEAGFPMGKLDAVLDAVREHQPKDEPRSLEATLLRDADICEQLGAIGLMRTVSKVGTDTRFYLLSDAAQSLGRAAEQLPSLLRLPAAQQIGQQRAEWLKHCLNQLYAEAGSHLG